MPPAPLATVDPWTILTSAVRTATASQHRADDLLRARGLHLTQLRLLLDIDDRRIAYASQLGRDLLLSKQAVHHQLAALRRRGALRIGPEGYTRRVVLTPEGRELASRGLDDLAPLLDRLVHRADAHGIVEVLASLEAASRPPRPRWQL